MLPEELRSLPYLVHTNRELGLMLRGEKPMAVFSWFAGQEDELTALMRYLRMFDRHTAAGRFVREAFSTPTPLEATLIVRRVYYCLPGETWRVAAMETLMSETAAWTPAFERRFGELLGYEDSQNDIWAARVAARSATASD